MAVVTTGLAEDIGILKDYQILLSRRAYRIAFPAFGYV